MRGLPKGRTGEAGEGAYVHVHALLSSLNLFYYCYSSFVIAIFFGSADFTSLVNGTLILGWRGIADS